MKAFVLFTFFYGALAQAFEFPIEGMTGGPPKTRITATATFFPWDTSQWLNGSLSLPLYKGEQNSLGATAQASSLKVPQTYYLSKASGTHVPHLLKSQQYGLGFNRKLDDERSWSVRGSLGSASDKPFESKEVNVVTATASYLFPSETTPGDKWIVLVFYSNNNPVFKDIPIPGFAYFMRRPEMLAVFGLPFAYMKWFPKDAGWNATLLTFGGTSWRTEIANGSPFGGPSGFVGLEWTQQTWLREGRSDTKDKLFYDQKQTHIGYRMPVAKGVMLEAQLGYSFQREFFESKSYFSEKSSETARLPDNGFFNLQAKADF